MSVFSIGMTVTHAQSLIPDLPVVDATPRGRMKTALFRLALWCIKYSPLVTPDPPDGVFIDVAGSAHLFQGEAALLQDLCQRLAREGIYAQAALADTPGCAWAVARYGKEVSSRRAAPRKRLRACRSPRFGFPMMSVASLHDVGIERVAQLASKPRASLSLRFGNERSAAARPGSWHRSKKPYRP